MDLYYIESRSNDKSNDFISNLENRHSIKGLKNSNNFYLAIKIKGKNDPFIFDFDEFTKALKEKEIDDKIEKLKIDLTSNDFPDEIIFKSKNPNKLENLKKIEIINTRKYPADITFDVSDSFKNKYDNIKFIIESNYSLSLGFNDEVPNNIKFDLSSIEKIIYNKKYDFNKFFEFFFDEENIDLNWNVSISDQVKFLVETCEQIEKVAHYWLNVDKSSNGNQDCNKDLEISETSAFWNNSSNVKSLSFGDFSFNSLKMNDVAYDRFDFNFDSSFERMFNNTFSLKNLSGNTLSLNFENPAKIELINTKGNSIHFKGDYNSILKSQITFGGDFTYDNIYFYEDFIYAILDNPKIIKIDRKITTDNSNTKLFLFFNLNNINSVTDFIKLNKLTDAKNFLKIFEKNIFPIDNSTKIFIKDGTSKNFYSILNSLEKEISNLFNKLKFLQIKEDKIKFLLNYFKLKENLN